MMIIKIVLRILRLQTWGIFSLLGQVSIKLGYLTARRLQLLHTDITVLQPGGRHAHGAAEVARNVFHT